MEGVSCLKPEGAFYIMMNVEKQLGRVLYGEVIRSSDDFSAALLKRGLPLHMDGAGKGPDPIPIQVGQIHIQDKGQYSARLLG